MFVIIKVGEHQDLTRHVAGAQTLNEFYARHPRKSDGPA
jgi:hypothetical protein